MTDIDRRVAIVGILATLSAAIAAPLVAGWLSGQQQDRQLVSQRATEDRRELRRVLDEAMLELERADNALRDISLTSGGRRDDLEQTQRDLVRSQRDVQLDQARLNVRLGSAHVLPRRYSEAIEVISAGWICLTRGGAEPFNEPGRIFRAVVTLRRALDALRELVNQDATALVGAKLPDLSPSGSRELAERDKKQLAQWRRISASVRGGACDLILR